MADNTSDDVYDDPDNILADNDDTVDGSVELPEEETDDLSQSIFLPEKDDDDPRGTLEPADITNDEETDEAFDEHAEDLDPDSLKLGDVNPADEKDGTEN